MVKNERMYWSIVTLLIIFLLLTPLTSAQTSQELSMRGFEALGRGENDIALEYFEKALSMNPKNRGAVEGKIEALFNMGHEREALEFVDVYVEKFEKNPLAWAIRGQVYGRVGKHEIASESFDRAIHRVDQFIDRDPENPLAWEMRGDVFVLLGDFDSARESYERAIELNPDARERIESKFQEIKHIREEVEGEIPREEKEPFVRDEERPFVESQEQVQQKRTPAGGKLRFLTLLDWEAVGVILVVFGAIGGWFMTKRKKGRIRRLLDDVDTAYSTFKMKSRRCEAELYRLKDVISEEFKNGKIDEQSFSILDKRIDDYLGEVREQIMNEKFGGLPRHLKDEMHKMLEDGEVSTKDVAALNHLLDKATGLSEGEKDDLLKTMKKWEKKDR